ncbi:2-oxo acid dehydrogenase subunit E2, partial [Pseudomonas aeruginosa]|nr:2-oxo acid dehydrogenase subunit E2 [Pseudomonas aeruginosa]
ACYALAGSSAPNDGTASLLVSLAWPWDEQWWKPTTVRRDLVKACALALVAVPDVNIQFDEAAQSIRRFTDADISVAVALPAGLITPIVRSANRKSISDISNEIH